MNFEINQLANMNIWDRPILVVIKVQEDQNIANKSARVFQNLTPTRWWAWSRLMSNSKTRWPFFKAINRVVPIAHCRAGLVSSDICYQSFALLKRPSSWLDSFLYLSYINLFNVSMHCPLSQILLSKVCINPQRLKKKENEGKERTLSYLPWFLYQFVISLI